MRAPDWESLKYKTRKKSVQKYLKAQEKKKPECNQLTLLLAINRSVFAYLCMQ